MAIETIPLINGVAHDWGCINLLIGGVAYAGVTKIDYSEEQTIEDNYGIGLTAVSRGYGQITYSCKITLLGETSAALEAVAPAGRLQNLGMFPVVVAYIPKGATIKTVHRLLSCEFKGNSRSVGTGDTKIETEYELKCGQIRWK